MTNEKQTFKDVVKATVNVLFIMLAISFGFVAIVKGGMIIIGM